MAAEVNGRRVRRTQAERSAAMRTRLLDATIECLVSYGYAETDHAASRPACRRHSRRADSPLPIEGRFGGRGHRASRSTTRAGRDPRARRVEASDDPVSTVLDFLWDAHQGPMFIAAVELWVAARTDPVLAGHIERMEPVVNGTWSLRLPSWCRPCHAKRAAQLVYTAMDALRGILVASSSTAIPIARGDGGTAPAGICGSSLPTC